MKTDSFDRHSFYLASLIALMGVPGSLSGELLVSDSAAFEVQHRAATDADQVPDTFRQAKNVILFVGDGMGISTVTAARILDGQQRGESGEENSLFFESFPDTGLAKTYSVNMQTPDSASTMTAIMSGHKTKGMVVGYDANIVAGDHTATSEFGGPSKRLMTLLERFEIEGKPTGIVTTTSVTHTTPASCYAHSASRMWECGNYFRPSLTGIEERYEQAIGAGFKGIALQLVEFPFGDGIDVILGGRRRGFVPAGLPGAKGNALSKGRRIDGRNLIVEWAYQVDRDDVSTRSELMELVLPRNQWNKDNEEKRPKMPKRHSRHR
jgi:alkaline phosphatase